MLVCIPADHARIQAVISGVQLSKTVGLIKKPSAQAYSPFLLAFFYITENLIHLRFRYYRTYVRIVHRVAYYHIVRSFNKSVYVCMDSPFKYILMRGCNSLHIVSKSRSSIFLNNADSFITPKSNILLPL